MNLLLSAIFTVLVLIVGTGAYGVKSKYYTDEPEPEIGSHAACTKLLCNLEIPIKDRKDWLKWVLINHPDKIDGFHFKTKEEQNKITELIAMVNHCAGDKSWCGSDPPPLDSISGGKRKRKKSKRRKSTKTKKTRKSKKKTKKKSRK